LHRAIERARNGGRKGRVKRAIKRGVSVPAAKGLGKIVVTGA